MTIGQALDQAIAERDTTQAEAAAQIGVSQQVLSRWIAGAYTPKASYVPALARFLRLSQAEVRQLRAASSKMREPIDRSELDRIEAKIDAQGRDLEHLTRLVEKALGLR